MSKSTDHSLDPEDFASFRGDAHRLLDACLDHLEAARDRPWHPVDNAARAALAPGLPETGIGERQLACDLAETVLPFGTGNTHPRFFGWVHGSGLAAGLLADITASAMNSNCGGRDHGAIYVERAVIDWTRRIFGFPETAGGLLTSGTSQSTVIALAVARIHTSGHEIRANGLRDAPDHLAYCAAGAHSANQKALELLGHGAQALRRIPTTGPSGGMDLARLKQQLAEDRAAGKRPFCVIATVGSVDTGACDDIAAIADLCAEEKLWLHIDGAFGCWARIADRPWRDLAGGIERADSLAFDFHKWMYVQYDCGAVLIRHGDVHRAAFATRPHYLEGQEDGLGGGDPWYCDYGIELSRGFRALKVWSCLRAYGLDRLARKISDNCRQAARMARLVESADELELGAPVVLNVCCFRYAPKGVDPQDQDVLNRRLATRLQLDGKVVFSTTRLKERTFLRAAIVNHRTRDEDIGLAIAAVREACAALGER
ncbi:MAG TPA: pyridoxal-dependent decarboxylase [Dongiaceae bacterium]|nr:pyridoxal-dependent decarboxylase [Dongiaceae bacterium]